MLRTVHSELVHRGSRTLALLLGILIATTSFAVLTGTSESQRLQVRGTVAKSFRSDYDILVRPRGSRNSFEQRTGQVQPNFLSGIFGGISDAQWRTVRGLPGIDVAAPIANVGYVLATAQVPIDLSRAAGQRGRVLLRMRVRWHTDRGLTRLPEPASYLYVTSNRLTAGPGLGTPGLSSFEADALREHIPGRRKPALICTSLLDATEEGLAGPFSWRTRTQAACFSRASHAGRIGNAPFRRGRSKLEFRWTFPLLLSAIDPGEEARLTGLDRAVIDGRFLKPGDRPQLLQSASAASDPSALVPKLPVLVAARPLLDEQAEIAIERLPAASARGILRQHYSEQDTLKFKRYLDSQPHGRVIERRRVDSTIAYAQLLRDLRDSGRPELQSGDVFADQFWRIGPTTYRRNGSTLIAQLHRRDDRVWAPYGNFFIPAAAKDDGFRRVRSVMDAFDAPSDPQDAAPVLSRVGVFDPDRLRTTRGPGSAPATVYQPPSLTGRDERSTGLLGGRQLEPSGNVAGYLAQPPGLLTTLRGARVYTSATFPDTQGQPPISAIRVRVAGVTGPDAVSRERIRQAAERIATRTGLDVDITAGSSGAPTAVDLPAGRYGRPELALSEPWIRKGVATHVLNAVDRKSVVLFALILVVCALFVANAASAAVRARRTELGVLAALGWSTGRLFAVVLLEVGIVGLIAGLLGGLLALPLAELVGITASIQRLALAVAAATLLALLAGLAPATRAARADPTAAIQPLVLEARRAWRPRSVGALAVVNLVRTPGRTALAALSLAIGVCALTLLLAATIAFNDTLVGTLLGGAVAVEVRSTDYIAVAATVLLGAASVADVLFLNLRERAGELATLRATGWDEAALGRLVGLEGLWIGAVGGLVGALAGLAGAAVFAGAVPFTLVLVALGTAVGGALLAAAAALAPATWLRRASLIPLLAGE